MADKKDVDVDAARGLLADIGNTFEYAGQAYVVKFKIKAFRFLAEQWGIKGIHETYTKLIGYVQDGGIDEIVFALRAGLQHTELTPEQIEEIVEDDNIGYSPMHWLALLINAINSGSFKGKEKN